MTKDREPSKKIKVDAPKVARLKIRLPKIDFSKMDLDEAEEIMKRYRAARSLPDGDEKRALWLPLGELTPRFLSPLWRHLPDPLLKRGRPQGRSKVDEQTLLDMDQRVGRGEKPTTAARAIVGDIAGSKNAADHIVKVWKEKRGK